MMLVEPLEWDSEFFGFPIGRVNLNGATPESLSAIDAQAHELGLSCLYGSLDPDATTTATLVQQFGHRLVEVAVTLGRPEGPFTLGNNTNTTARRGTLDDLPHLNDAIDLLAPWSRFGSDPRFGPAAARRMHQAWVERAARDDDRMLAVAEDDTGIIGVSAHVRRPIPRVDFMGVTKPGIGASWALMQEFLDWAGGGPVEGGPCAARNIAPIRYLERCGFSVVRTQYLYHRWFDEPGEAS